eukprot:6887496-Pyramimonas_sp.AAC.1
MGLPLETFPPVTHKRGSHLVDAHGGLPMVMAGSWSDNEWDADADGDVYDDGDDDDADDDYDGAADDDDGGGGRDAGDDDDDDDGG